MSLFLFSFSVVLVWQIEFDGINHSLPGAHFQNYYSPRKVKNINSSHLCEKDKQYFFLFADEAAKKKQEMSPHFAAPLHHISARK